MLHSIDDLEEERECSDCSFAPLSMVGIRKNGVCFMTLCATGYFNDFLLSQVCACIVSIVEHALNRKSIVIDFLCNGMNLGSVRLSFSMNIS